MPAALRVVTVVGARPQFIKAAPLSRALREPGSGVEELIVHTGQHYDASLSEVFFRQLGIPAPDVRLDVGSHSPAVQTARILEALDSELRRLSPDKVLVYGDTNSTVAGALAAAHLGVEVAHVEAGLRSFNRSMPEEINRVLTDHLAGLLFCPTRQAVLNLAQEGITSGVHQVGDVMCDAVRLFGAVAQRESDVLDRLGLAPGEFFLATIHRAGNTDDPDVLGALVEALLSVQNQLAPVVWPIHPRARKELERRGLDDWKTLLVTDPLPYLDTQKLIQASRAVLTDSGGMQKEAFFHRVPCLTLRDETEWVETVEGGFNQLVGCDPEAILEGAREAAFPHLDPPPLLYGDGNAAGAIARLMGAR